MNCSRWHQLIALHVGGDLGPDRAVRVEQHLENCPACRDLAEGLVSDRDALARFDARASVDLDLGSIRGAVLAEIAARRRPLVATLRSPRFAVGSVAVVAVIAVLAIMVPGAGQREPIVVRDALHEIVPVVEESLEIPEVEPPVPEEVTPVPPAIESVKILQNPPLQPAHADVPAVRTAAISPSVPSEPMTMKILTNDPDVVIYWIVDSKGAEDA